MDELGQELRTETLSNSRGWTAVRVTHQPTGTVVERARSESLRSAVQAQRECIDELRSRLANGETTPRETQPDQQAGRTPAAANFSPAFRAELDALITRVEQMDERLRHLERRQRGSRQARGTKRDQ